eukprot:gene7368-13106_t
MEDADYDIEEDTDLSEEEIGFDDRIHHRQCALQIWNSENMATSRIAFATMVTSLVSSATTKLMDLMDIDLTPGETHPTPAKTAKEAVPAFHL